MYTIAQPSKFWINIIFFMGDKKKDHCSKSNAIQLRHATTRRRQRVDRKPYWCLVTLEQQLCVGPLRGHQ